jgi:predicted MFS family arabinose efflux permease
MSVANVYYAQPLLDTFAADFGITHAAVGGIVTATQLGCALALLCLVPLGDLMHRKTLMCMQMLGLVCALLLVTTASTVTGLLAGMLVIGLLGTAMTQGLIAYAALLADKEERGHVIGTVQGGVVTGLLLARVLSGIISDIASWHAVYMTSAVVMVAIGLLLWRALPATSTPSQQMSYPALLRSMVHLLATHRTLQVRGMLAFFLFAALSIFWSAIVLPLHAAPYHYTHSTIGAFGLVGMAGAIAATRAGKFADRGYTRQTTGIALLLLLASWAALWFTSESLILLIIGILLLDIGAQAIHVVNQSMIFSDATQAQSRLVSCYMLFYATGSGAGAITATAAYDAAGWHGVCLLGGAVSLGALAFWAATLRLPRIEQRCAV